MSEQISSKLMGQIQNKKLVAFVDAKIGEGMARYGACRLWATMEGVSAKTVLSRYNRMKKLPIRKDGRCRKHGISDEAILAAIYHYSDLGTPLSATTVKNLAYFGSPSARADTKATWLRRFCKTYRSMVQCWTTESGTTVVRTEEPLNSNVLRFQDYQDELYSAEQAEPSILLPLLGENS